MKDYATRLRNSLQRKPKDQDADIHEIFQKDQKYYSKNFTSEEIALFKEGLRLYGKNW